MNRLEKKSFGIVITLLLASSLLISGAVSLFAAESKPRYGGVLRLSDQNEGVSIGYPPKMVRVTNTTRQAAPALEGLIRNDKTGKPAPWLATAIKEDAKAKTITLTLRKDVKFHDGTDFNAEAAKWNLDQQLAAKSQGSEKFKSIDVIDNYAVRINLSEWDSTVTGNLTQALGLMVSPTAYKKNGEEWSMKNPVGTGPFQFVSWEKDVRITYKKFDHYWQKGKPYLDGITWTPVADQMTRQMSLRRGELDVVLSVTAKDLAGLEKDGFMVRRARVGSGAYGLIPDSANPSSPFADVRVRRATQHAIDTATIAKTIFYGEVEPATQFVFKGHWGYNPTVSGYPYNPAKAKQLLAEAGYPNGFKTKLLYRTNPELDQLFVAVQGYLRAVGIDAELDPMQSGRYDQIAFQGVKWGGLLMNSVSSNSDVPAVLSIRYAGGGNFYSSMLVPDDYTKALQNAITAPNFKDKQKWTREVMKLMIDKHCLQIPIYCSSDFAVSKTSVHGHGVMENPEMVGVWTPADAWLER